MSTTPDILPDSRLKQLRGQKWSNAWGCMSVPIFCANCGADGGHVPEHNCDFAFYMCNTCAEQLGPLTGHYMMPDEAFRAKVAADNGLTQ